MIVVDQMRPDYLERFGDLYQGGLARLARDGVRFERAYHDHAATETGVGHATIATGCLPRHHGIVGNVWWDRTAGREVYCCEDDSAGVYGHPGLPGLSARHLLRPTLSDRLAAHSAKSRVVAVALKDRAAILSAGRSAHAVLWYYSREGAFVTPEACAGATATWVDSLRTSRFVESYCDSVWTRMLPDSVYASRSRPDRFAWESDSLDSEFPHALRTSAADGEKDCFREISGTPFGDQMVLRLAAEAVSRFGLGADADPDLLLVSCSAADYVGHSYGPYSQEVQDHYLRLDLYLDHFFGLLDSTVGRDNYVVVLTSDHGGQPLPEELRLRGVEAERIPTVQAQADVQAAAARASENLHLDSLKLVEGPGGYNVIMPAEPASPEWRARIDSALVATIQEIPWVAAAYTRSELVSGAPPRDPYLQLYRNGFHLDRGTDVVVRERQNSLISSYRGGTSHGSPYEYDTHVPLMVAGAGIPAGVRTDSVRTVDIAPTVFTLLGFGEMPACDGRALLVPGRTRKKP